MTKNNSADAFPEKKPSTTGEEAQRPKDENDFPVVAIGASAGGLRALQELFNHLSADTGMAFVVIVHLSSEHESNLPQLLARHTEMPVDFTGKVKKLAPDQVFVIPPDRTLTLKDGTLQLSEREKAPGKFKPIDRFFESLAEQMGEKAIGVILSGTGSDGTSGIEAIKTSGGITFAQAEGSAQFAEMPRNAVSSGHVDFVLPPKDIARQLGEPIRCPYRSSPLPPAEEDASSDWAEIHRLLKTRGGDFSQYKHGTLRRRISRRMSIHKITELSEYAALLKDDPQELAALREDLLIKVTEFFRDAEMFEALEKKVFPKILEVKRDDESIRVWVPGCASGEEVYSLAMALTEFQGKSGSHFQVQIFGTDVSEEAIDKARQGFYVKGQLPGVSQDRLGKFFLPVTGGFKVKKHLREMCVFARQDFISDPPFSRLDLISCRNVLIYFDPSLQKKVFPLFHYALNPDGFLVLGSAENVSQAGNLFSSIDEKNRIFRKKAAQREFFASWGYRKARQPSSPKKVQPFEHRQKKGSEQKLHREVDRYLLRRLDPAAVVVDSALNVVEFRGNTAPFIEHHPGKATLDLLKITRDTLRLDLQTLLRDAQEKDEPQTREHLYREAGQERTLTLEASPLHFDQELFFLVRFVPGPAQPNRPEPTQAPDKIRDEALWLENQRLKKDLGSSLELIQQAREEKNAALEDLNASNEEVLSSNEELQSINEELETSKEELESSVEELNTVNQELQRRNEELKHSQSDLYTLVESVQIPFLILNEDLTIRRISPDAKRTLNVSPGDAGRSVTELNLSFELQDLENILTRIIRSGQGEEIEILGRNGRWYLLRIDPIEAEESARGAVLALFDIDRLKRSLEETEKAYKYSLRIVDTIKDPLLVLDENLLVKKANPAFYQKFQVNPKETEGREIFSLGSGQWDRPELRSLLSEILPQSMQMDNFQVEFDFPHLGPRTMLLSARRMKATFSPHEAILLGITDVTDQKKIEDYLRRAKQSAEETSRAKSEFLANLSHEIRTPMTVIIGALTFIEEASLDPEQKRLTEMAARSAQSLLDLLDDLLDFSRIEVDKIKIDSEPFDLRQNLEDAVDILQLEAERKGLGFSWHIAEEVPSAVLGDRKRLRQVLVNLVGNALKFTEMGRIDIAVEVSRGPYDKETPALLFSIRDTGIGITAEDISRLFQNFTQLDSSRTRRYGGTGLGLAICRGLIERMGGKIWVESRAGEGSTFFFTLPLQVSSGLAEATGQEEAQPSSGRLPTPAGASGAKILLGEDDRNIRELVGLMLKTWGWDVICAGNGREALDKHEAENPDLILMDLQMPVMDGLQAAREIRKREAGEDQRVPILGFTAHARRQERDQCLEAGMDDILTKPVDMEKLQALIRDYLER